MQGAQLKLAKSEDGLSDGDGIAGLHVDDLRRIGEIHQVWETIPVGNTLMNQIDFGLACGGR